MRRSALALALALASAGCGSDTVGLDWTYAFGPGVSRASVARLRAFVRPGECGPDTNTVYDASWALGAEPVRPPAIGEGRFAFTLEATAADCQILAGACTALDLPGPTALPQTLVVDRAAPARCAARDCSGGRCEEPGPFDAGPPGSCEPGFIECDGRCVSLGSPQHCGECDNDCGDLRDATGQCERFVDAAMQPYFECAIDRCNTNYFDCDGDARNGCEERGCTCEGASCSDPCAGPQTGQCTSGSCSLSCADDAEAEINCAFGTTCTSVCGDEICDSVTCSFAGGCAVGCDNFGCEP